MHSFTLKSIQQWLQETEPSPIQELYRQADSIRAQNVGNEIHLRGLVEISNHCMRQCQYCGLRAGNTQLSRYRMNHDQILECAHRAKSFGYGTVVLQSGEDPAHHAAWVAELVQKIKKETGLAITLSLGERTPADWKLFRQAGADRYLLRFETSDSELYGLIHPSIPGIPSNRLGSLRILKQLGYEVGSGVMVGIPGQTWESLAQDILLFQELDLDMIGIGPFLAHPATPLGQGQIPRSILESSQVPNSEELTYRAVALARLLRPDANIPSTTAIATLNQETGRQLALSRGANVVMPNLTPLNYRKSYEIYPGKALFAETAEGFDATLRQRIAALGRTIGSGPGGRPKCNAQMQCPNDQ